MTLQAYQEVLSKARQLPLTAQVELAEALLHTIRATLPQSPSASPGKLLPLWELNDEELKALAEAIVAPERQQQIHLALQKQRTGSLGAEDGAKLDAWLAEADQVALLKARAMYTLKLRQAPPTIAA